MKKNSLNFIIIILIVLICLVSFFLLFDNQEESNELIFELYGEEYTYHNLGTPYFDPGVKAIENNVDVSSSVVITGEVNTNLAGIYTKTYTYKDKTLTRTIEVKKLTSFNLKGEDIVYIVLNGKYDDPKVEAYYNGEDYVDKIKISGDVDTSKPGVYTVTYYFQELNKTLSRRIYVSDFSEWLKISYSKEATNKNVDITITVDKDKVSKYTLPDGSSREDNSTYTVSSNGTYKFTVYDKYNNNYVREINIDNIDSVTLDGSCKAVVKNNQTTITVTSNKKITKYVYNGVESTKNPYTVNKVIQNNKVTIYDSFGNKKVLTCKASGDLLDGKLEIHFIASGAYDDSILIRNNSKIIYIDGGRASCATKDIAYLKELGIKKIDYMIGSHVEFDHIEAQADILDNFSVDKIIYPVDIYKCRSNCQCERDNDVRKMLSAMKKHNKTAITQSIPSVLNIGDITIYFIAPLKKTCNNNNNSFIFILKYGKNTFMFTGDSYSSMHDTNGLLANAKSLGLSTIHVDVFKHPHHGNDPMYDKTLNAIKPTYMIVPNYRAPQYPSQSNLTRIKNHGIKVYRQSDSKTGNITIISDGTNITIKMDSSASTYKR